MLDEKDLRSGIVQDPYVRAFDSSFWKGDTANGTFDSVRNAIRIGDTSLVGSMSSYSQYLYGDFEFTISVDSLSPDSNDKAVYPTEAKRFGLVNMGDTLERGAAYFEMRFDSLAGGDTLNTRPLRAVITSEAGVVQRKNITWDTTWGQNARYRIKWESDGYSFLINDTVVATLGDRVSGTPASFQINTSIPQALRVSNRIVDIPEAMALKFLNVRNSRMINNRLML